ncbi:MAG: serine--tRNA ligase [Thaumarchaeota archaeon]|jgi:seryl-tRNA synthetase|nr:serine--tRNA ligase [Candidatus Terraquivivens yellowstonensis]MCL7394751.1 serine--tRNA ligase [Candidatus Terraquivivens yellowstonensis]MCL7399072.1 serine--tRNA ligase [Candidatus Terraquivivens yellowstonensis]
MIDIKIIRDNPGFIKDMLTKRGLNLPIDELLEWDKERRSLMVEVQNLRHRKNIVALEVANMKKEGRDPITLMQEMKIITDEIARLEDRIAELENKINYVMMRIPNIPHESVPPGTSEEDNVEVRRWGKIPEFDFEVKDHDEIAIGLGLLEIERASKASGARFYYLKNELVKLNIALIRFALDLLTKKGFEIYQTPYMLRRWVIEGVTSLQDFEDMIYKIEGEDLYLIATSEHSLAALHANEVLDGRRLPLRYAGVSPCFRKEAGAHGKDTKGIFRVHQFEKVEQFVFCKPEQSWEEHEFLLSNAEEIYQKLGLPYRVVNICLGELGVVAAKKYDIEVWMPAQRRYREIVSCSNCTDYQARRLNIRYREMPHEERTKYVHTLNSTAIATERTIAAILENYQQKDGSVIIPEVLRPYMDGMEVLKPKKE